MSILKNSYYSYWELKHYFSLFDLIVIGSGIVGLSTAISFKQKNKKARVLVLERGFLPNGASTKNAGFACFGSAGEILEDLKKMPEQVVWETVEMRWKGLQLLRKRFKDKELEYLGYGGYEIFENKSDFSYCSDQLNFLNKKMKQVLGLKECYTPVSLKKMHFGNTCDGILNRFEGQLDTARMMDSLQQFAVKSGVQILNNILVKKISEHSQHVELMSEQGIFKAHKVVVATNAFAGQLLSIKDVQPARAQVLVTKAISSLPFKGCFHFENGFYYFRNVGNRVLFGGGRNLDIIGETTDTQALNKQIQNQLDHYLKELILPGIPHEVEHRWSGIMGLGKEKKPIIQFVSPRVLAAVRMGGMGIAIGSWVGEKAAASVS